MAVTVRLFKILQFEVPPEGFCTKEQLDLFTGSGDKPTTGIWPDNSAPISDLVEYRVRHETLVNRGGRTGVLEFDHFIEATRFQCYISAPDQRLFSVGARSDIARQAFERILNSDLPEALKVRVAPICLDLQSAQESILRKGAIAGGWFKDLKIENVSSASFFGQDVTQSNEWEKYGELGNLSSLNVHLEVPNEGDQHIWVTSDCAVVFLSNGLPIPQCLSLSAGIFDTVERSMTVGQLKLRRR